MLADNQMRTAIIILVLLAAICGVLLVVLRPADDGLDAFPHTYLAAAGYDPALVVVVPGPLALPPPAPEGCQPAWQCDDPAFKDAAGLPWLFPLLRPTGDTPPVPPKHPRLKRSPTLDTCHPYRTAEGLSLLAAFRERSQP